MPLNPADAAFAARLERQVGADVLRPVEPRYLEEPRGQYAGHGGLLALPRTVEEVSAIITAAAEARVGVVPYGGGTGLVGGQVAEDGGSAPLILSLERMTAIRAVYPEENVMIAEAGAILADVQAAARGADRLFPLSLAAEGSARIGGNLSTNAGGVNVLRYGTARELCLGLEAVLPDGRIWHGLKRLRKDNTGYDLRDLLCGAEGTLGVITAAALKLSPIPAEIGTAALIVPDPRAALGLLALAQDRLGEMVSAFELIHRQGLDFLSETLPDIRQPFADKPEWQVLIEIGLARGMDPVTALGDLFEAAMERDLVSDGIVAQSEGQRADLWNVREHIPDANRRIGAIASHDISLPLSCVPDFIQRAPQKIAAIAEVRINCFGHLGDGNLHYNLFPVPGRTRAEYKDQKPDLTHAVYDLVAEMGGSISAEHGIGRLKAGELERYGDPVKLAAMRAIKDALDPCGIMNPGAVLFVDGQA
ncbi:FAD-binding oxidoreductase [Chachezhania antarctica]|uniref:FAD-binding oxidoreductase n=1 Tax=Chachezhania antarctica TaxID=2340860 RepID=UPI000EB03B25|nr:FAD-binding oxidoreductase [Chachezhania antarctica]|tara:strand:- start:1860 stop:3290 length:1431 start_codon:yes stop_codon:yes gene_type:complete